MLLGGMGRVVVHLSLLTHWRRASLPQDDLRFFIFASGLHLSRMARCDIIFGMTHGHFDGVRMGVCTWVGMGTSEEMIPLLLLWN